eukprot:GEMP01069656.1.p1 GENE.GEMP01069656.1~~GEMP01069656.1.p1  ORF type:complete len:384 (+),score=49.66 GEMP01069656.1:95-1246(+)
MALPGRVILFCILALSVMCTNLALWWASKHDDWMHASVNNLRTHHLFDRKATTSPSKAISDNPPAEGVATAVGCAVLCDKYSGCASFEYSPLVPQLQNTISAENNCHLDTKASRSGLKYGNFVLYLRRNAFTNEEIIGSKWKPVLAGRADNKTLDAWIDGELPLIPVVPIDPLAFTLSFNHVDQNGLWLEFGVYKGETSTQIAAFRKTKGNFTTVFGFDSFTGLPEDWEIGAMDSKLPSARVIASWVFDLKGTLPRVASNVQLVKGWFNETLPSFLAEHPGPVTLLHIDCDLYSSTSYVLTVVAPRLQPGTVIVFDELVNFPQFRQHEIRALHEFIRNSTGFSFEWLSTPCGIDSVLGFPVGALEGDGFCLAVAIRLLKRIDD